jgi:hypothetical protein
MWILLVEEYHEKWLIYIDSCQTAKLGMVRQFYFGQISGSTSLLLRSFQDFFSFVKDTLISVKDAFQITDPASGFSPTFVK